MNDALCFILKDGIHKSLGKLLIFFEDIRQGLKRIAIITFSKIACLCTKKASLQVCVLLNNTTVGVSSMETPYFLFCAITRITRGSVLYTHLFIYRYIVRRVIITLRPLNR